MLNNKDFFNLLKNNNITFFTGVPDSLLKNFCAYITSTSKKHIIAANEGNAIGIAAGNYVATKKIPLVYMQNSGLGNAINPLISLVDNEVYSIPILLMIGWRGEPGIKDEPQHIKQGKITLPLLDCLNISYEILSDNIAEAKNNIKKAVKYMKEKKAPYALIIRKNSFEEYKLKKNSNYKMSREEAIKMVLNSLKNEIVISTTGKISRELFEYREELNQEHKKDFLTVGSMGHASQIALGIAIEKPNKKIYCFDGDGAAIMHMGGLGIIGSIQPKNFKHIIFNNECHESVGGQPTIGNKINFAKLAKELNYKKSFQAKNKKELLKIIPQFNKCEGPTLLEIKINKKSRKNLGRPTTTPIKNKNNFMRYIQND